MFQLTYNEFKSDTFIETLAKLERAKGLPAKVAYDIGCIIKEIYTALGESQKKFHAHLKTHAVWDTEGKLVRPDKVEGQDQPQYTILPEKQKDWAKVCSEFFAETFTVHRHKIEIDQLTPCGFSPGEILALGPILLT